MTGQRTNAAWMVLVAGLEGCGWIGLGQHPSVDVPSPDTVVAEDVAAPDVPVDVSGEDAGRPEVIVDAGADTASDLGGDTTPVDVSPPDAGSDAGLPGGRCSWAGGPPAFGVARNLGLPNTAASEVDPVLAHDGLTLYFVSYRASSNDVYRATRHDVADRFGVGTLDTGVSTGANETHLFVGPDDREAFVSSDRTGTAGGMDLFRATRASPADPWGPFAPVREVSSPGNDFDPHLEADGRTLWLDPVDRPGGVGRQDIFFAVRADPAAPFASPQVATALDTAANEWDVSLTDDARVVVFASDRDGALHVHFATRPVRGADFGPPSIVHALDPYLATLVDPFVSPDGCSIYFSAELPGGEGHRDLYVVEATP